MIIGTGKKLFRCVECWSKLKRNVSWDKNFRNVYENPAHSNIINHSIIKLKRLHFFTKRRCDDFTVATKLLFRKLIQKFSQCSLGSRLGSRRQKGWGITRKRKKGRGRGIGAFLPPPSPSPFCACHEGYINGWQGENDLRFWPWFEFVFNLSFAALVSYSEIDRYINRFNSIEWCWTCKRAVVLHSWILMLESFQERYTGVYDFVVWAIFKIAFTFWSCSHYGF